MAYSVPFCISNAGRLYGLSGYMAGVTNCGFFCFGKKLEIEVSMRVTWRCVCHTPNACDLVSLCYVPLSGESLLI